MSLVSNFFAWIEGSSSYLPLLSFKSRNAFFFLYNMFCFFFLDVALDVDGVCYVALSLADCVGNIYSCRCWFVHWIASYFCDQVLAFCSCPCRMVLRLDRASRSLVIEWLPYFGASGRFILNNGSRFVHTQLLLLFLYIIKLLPFLYIPSRIA